MEGPIEAWEFLNSPIGLAMKRVSDEMAVRKLISELEAREKAIRDALDKEDAV
jgi:hypothetical protein